MLYGRDLGTFLYMHPRAHTHALYLFSPQLSNSGFQIVNVQFSDLWSIGSAGDCGLVIQGHILLIMNHEAMDARHSACLREGQ